MISLQPQVFDLLEYLVRNRGRVVTKDDLIAAVWGGRIVSESSLTTRINAARNAVGDSGEKQQLIRTLPRKGLRFIGTVREQSRGAGEPDAPRAPVESAAGTVQSSMDAARGRPWEERRTIWSDDVLEPCDSSARSDLPFGQSPQLALPDKPSIAVLPFTNMSADPEQEYFVDGITEDITTALSKWRWFFVIARNSSFVYKGRAIDAKEVARHFGVRYILEGSARKAGGRIRVNAQLIDVVAGNHIWADRYDRDLDDVFAVQDEITQCVAAAIGPALRKIETEEAGRRLPRHLGPRHLAAWDHFVRGMWHYHQFRDEESVTCLKQAVEVDATLAEAHAGIALVCLNRLVLRGIPEREAVIAEMIQSAQRALALDSDNPVANLVFSFALSYTGHAQSAFQFARRATELNGNFAAGHDAVALACAFLGRLEEGLTAIDLASRLDPSTPYAFFGLAVRAVILYLLGRYAEAVAASRQCLAMRSFHTALPALAAGCAQLGLIEDARDAVRELMANEHADKSIAAVVRRYVRAEDREHWARGLRAAGMPED